MTSVDGSLTGVSPTARRARSVGGFRAYGLLCRWQLLQLREMLPFIIFAQLMFATGAAIGLGFLFPDIDPVAASYLATGAFLLNLLMVGIIIVPGAATDAKTNGTFDYMWALPLPRFTYLLADITIWTLAVMPGLVMSLLITSWRYDFALSISPVIVPAVLISLLTAATLGYAVALRSPSGQVTNVFSNLMLVSIFLFSPLNFPLERLPGWLQGIHSIVPFASMADLMRRGLVGNEDANVSRAFVVIGVWCVVGVVATVRAVARRP